MPIVANHQRPRALRRPDIGVRSLLPDSGFVLEPDLYRRAGGAGEQRILQQTGEVFLKVSSSSATFFGWQGRGCSRVKRSLRSHFPIVLSCTSTANRRATSACKSEHRQRITLCSAGSGPAMTRALSAAIWASVRAGARPGLVCDFKPSMPSALYRCTQSRKVCRSMPFCAAASPRGRLSRTDASARSRRTCAASRHLPAIDRSSAAEWSVRVTVRAAPIRCLCSATGCLTRSNRNFGSLGIPPRVSANADWYKSTIWTDKAAEVRSRSVCWPTWRREAEPGGSGAPRKTAPLNRRGLALGIEDQPQRA